MDEEFFVVDALPDSVWGQVPGGPEAYNADLDECWQYMGSVREAECLRHEFRHRAHPGLCDARVYAHVFDDDSGPRLGRLIADGREVPLSDLDAGVEP